MSDCAYLLPVRRNSFSAPESNEWRAYFHEVSTAGCDIIVVDGSPGEIFAQHEAVFGNIVTHLRVDRHFGHLNDKVNGVHTGMAFTRANKIILADDDIRYTSETLSTVLRLLEIYEVVRPQNFLFPLPWWARIEAARMLINRGTLRFADYPGTCAFRRDAFMRAGDYDGDVLFDNEEIIRNFARQNLSIAYATNLFVRKRPPTFQKWLEQRPRQAYEDFGLRIKTSLFAAILPLAIALATLFGPRSLLVYITALVFISLALALRGWIRGRARRVIPQGAIFFAPLWLMERSVSTYVAFYWYLVRGGYPFGDRLLSKGIGRAWHAGARMAMAQVEQTKK
jgi:hypothetical protein